MKCKGVFFDLYGTLLIYGDMRAAWADWLTACYENLIPDDRSVSRVEFAQNCDGLFSKPEPPTDNNRLTVYERRIKSLAAAVRLTATNENIQRAAAASASAWQKHMTLDSETIPLLETLKPLKKLAIISNFDHPPHLRALVENLDLTRFFAAVLISGETGYKKPHPHMFTLALEQTGLSPDDVVYVGDTADDINGARAAGIQPILIQRGDYNKKQSIADFKANPQIVSQSEQATKIDGYLAISALSQLTGLLD